MFISPYILPLLISAAFVTAVGVYVFFLPRSRFTYGFLASASAAAMWSFAYAVELAVPSLESKILFSNFQFVAIAILPLTWLSIVLRFSGRDEWMEPSRFAFFCIIPTITILLTWTSPYHQLFRYNYTIIQGQYFPILIGQNGPWFWVHAAYSYLVFLFCVGFIYQSLDPSRSFYYWQGITLLLSTLIPLIVDVFYNLGFQIIPGYNLTSPFFSFSSVIMMLALFRFHLFNITPIARTALVEIMPDGMVVLDIQNRVIDINPAAETLLGCPRRKILGMPVTLVFQSWPSLLRRLRGEIPSQGDLAFRRGNRTDYFDVRISNLKNKRGYSINRLIVFRDVTERTRLFQEVQKLATTDSLTGLYNRRQLLDLAEKEFLRSGRYNRPLAAIMLDLDYFKHVNDTFGHLIGDRALQAIAQICRENLRAVDLIGRFGGEEFLIVLPETDSVLAAGTADRLRQTVEQLEIPTDQGIIHLTISLGVVSLYPNDSNSFEFLLHRVDQALYAAKQDGRNCVITLEPETI